MLVDTSVDYLNGYGSSEALRLASAIADNEPLEPTPAWDATDYRKAARIYRVCRGAGATLRSTIDCLLAQTCLRHDLDLLSKDRDFRVIARHFPLRLAAPQDR